MARILIVEDDPGIAEMLADYFEAVGDSVAVESNGAAALERVREYGPDAIILDLMLPVVNGVETARRLRLQDETSDIPIVAITAVERSDEFEEILMVDALIPKPFDMDIIASKIRHLMDPDKVHDSAYPTEDFPTRQS
jgi:DNA-binding response OmpR family regulator